MQGHNNNKGNRSLSGVKRGRRRRREGKCVCVCGGGGGGVCGGSLCVFVLVVNACVVILIEGIKRENVWKRKEE